jgi:rod shape-determining protein MreD
VSYYIGVPLLLFVALVEASVLPMFPIYGLQPNLMLILLVGWLIVRGANEAYIFAPIGGLMLGLVDSAPLGTALIGLAPLALLQDIRGAQLREGGFVAALAFVIVMSLFYNFVHLAVFTLQGQAGDWLTATLRIILPVAFLNVLVMVPLYGIMSLASPERQRSVYI